MKKLIEQYELVKETRYVFDGVEDTITGRIYKIVKGINAQYLWTISHYCRLESEMGFYTPSAPFGDTLEEIEFKFENYVMRFEKAVDWEANPYF